MVCTRTSPEQAGIAEKNKKIVVPMERSHLPQQSRKHSPMYKTTHPPTHSTTHPPTDQPIHPSNNPTTMCYISTAVRTASTDALIGTRDGISTFSHFPHAEERASRPQEDAFPDTTWPSSTPTPVLSPGALRAYVWGGCGTVVVAGAVRCRTIEPTPDGAY